jgi:hypothetical protein
MCEILEPLADQVKTLLGPEKIEKPFRITRRPVHGPQFQQNDRPGDNRKIEQHQQDGFDYRPGVKN